MNQSDLEYLARLSELACEANPNAYRRSVKWFALAGYLWVVACLALGAGLLSWIALSLWQGADFKSFMFGGLLLSGALLTAGASALWLRLEPPEGQALSREQAPELFRLLEKIGKKVRGPKIDQVLIDGDFNASIVQLPQWGLIGGASTNYLVVGLPMLMALSPDRLASVLAHEYGHLREGHGSQSAWIYRSRMAWQRFCEQLDDEENIVGFINMGFMRWYFPRFIAKSFALARQDEYAADRVASRLLSAEVTASAMKEIVVKSDWLDQEFWSAHWQRARTHAVPQGPFAPMQKALLLQPEAAFAQRSLRSAWLSHSSVADTHPGLRDRLEAIAHQNKADRSAPTWSQQSSMHLLGPSLPGLLQQLDKQWCTAHANAWREFHADMQRWERRATQLQASSLRNRAPEWTELGDLMLRLDPSADAAPAYERALTIQSDFADALRGLTRISARSEPAKSLIWAERLYDSSQRHRFWTAQHVLELLERTYPDDVDRLATWRKRLQEAERVEERMWEAFDESPWNDQLAMHDLSEFETSECSAYLRRQRPIRRAWLASKRLREFPWRRCYVLVVDLNESKTLDIDVFMHSLTQQVPTPGPCRVVCVQLGADIQQAPRGALAQLNLSVAVTPSPN